MSGWLGGCVLKSGLVVKSPNLEFQIPCHPIPSHPIPSHPIPTHPIPSPGGGIRSTKNGFVQNTHAAHMQQRRKGMEQLQKNPLFDRLC